MTKKLRPRKEYTQEHVDRFIATDYPVSNKFKDLSGQVFGKWQVLKFAGKKSKIQPTYFCKCSCDREAIQIVYGNHLRQGISTSCGCEHAETLTQNAKNNQKPLDYYTKIVQQVHPTYTILNKPIGTSEKSVIHCSKCNTEFKSNFYQLTNSKDTIPCKCHKSKTHDYSAPAKLYLCRLKRGEDVYYKLGITQQESLQKRYNSFKTPYTPSTVCYWEYEEMFYCKHKEQELLQLMRSFEEDFLFPEDESILCKGRNEVFKVLDKDVDEYRLTNFLNFFINKESNQ